jgi:hypothetical protein
MFIQTEDLNVRYNIDKETRPDNQEVLFCGKKHPLGEIRKLYDAYNEQKYGMFSFYDDMFQYTSLGLMDVLFTLHNIKDDIPVEAFLKRRIVYGKDFVYAYMRKYGITRKEVDEVEQKYYEVILECSPVAKNGVGFFKMRTIASRHLMVLKYPFKGVDTVIRQWKERYGKNEFTSLEVDYCGNKTEQEYLESLPKERFMYFDIAICQDGGALLEFINKNKIQDTQIITPFEHCGISEEARYIYFHYTEGVGPNNSRILYINEYGGSNGRIE